MWSGVCRFCSRKFGPITLHSESMHTTVTLVGFGFLRDDDCSHWYSSGRGTLFDVEMASLCTRLASLGFSLATAEWFCIQPWYFLLPSYTAQPRTKGYVMRSVYWFLLISLILFWGVVFWLLFNL